MVDCLVRRANGAQGIKFVVESTKNPEYIEHRIAAFLSLMEDEIANMTDEKFEGSKKALRAKKLPATTLGEQFWDFFREIVIQQYHFNRTNVEASLLKKLTKEEVLSFYKVSYSDKVKSSETLSTSSRILLVNAKFILDSHRTEQRRKTINIDSCFDAIENQRA
jgi:secreted Zn-dependent insulinase-like peptidase